MWASISKGTGRRPVLGSAALALLVGLVSMLTWSAVRGLPTPRLAGETAVHVRDQVGTRGAGPPCPPPAPPAPRRTAGGDPARPRLGTRADPRIPLHQGQSQSTRPARLQPVRPAEGFQGPDGLARGTPLPPHRPRRPSRVLRGTGRPAGAAGRAHVRRRVRG